jgi:Ca2+-binding RTX toxin-like protein
VVIIASNGTSPVTVPVGTTELQGSNLLIRPSLLNYLNAGEKVVFQASFSVSDGVNLSPSIATITVEGRDESAPPPSTGGSGGGGGSVNPPSSSGNPGPGGNTTPGAGGNPPPAVENAPVPPNECNSEQPPTSLKGFRSLLGTAEADVITGSKKKDMIIGGAGNDQLNGRRGNDKLYGECGDDTLIGGSGKDILDGGLGFDLLTGGIGKDTFRISLQDITEDNGPPDRILDFNLRKDRLDLDDTITRAMLTFADGMLMAQINEQLLPVAELSGLTNSNLTRLIQLV